MSATTPSVFVKGPAASKNKAKAMIRTITNEGFWEQLVAYVSRPLAYTCICSTGLNSPFRIKNHLEPLAVAANVTQSAFCRLDEVLLTFGALTMQYKDLRANKNGDLVVCDAILHSLEKRWSNADQDVFIAAVILNPFFKHRPFKPLHRFRPASIYQLFLKLWTRFFPEEAAPIATLYENVIDYMKETGDFVALSSSVMACLDMSERKVIYFAMLNHRT